MGRRDERRPPGGWKREGKARQGKRGGQVVLGFVSRRRQEGREPWDTRHQTPDARQTDRHHHLLRQCVLVGRQKDRVDRAMGERRRDEGGDTPARQGLRDNGNGWKRTGREDKARSRQGTGSQSKSPPWTSLPQEV